MPLVAALVSLTLIVAVAFVVVIWQGSAGTWQKIEQETRAQAAGASAQAGRLVGDAAKTAAMILAAASKTYESSDTIHAKPGKRTTVRSLTSLASQLPAGSRLVRVRQLPSGRLTVISLWPDRSLPDGFRLKNEHFRSVLKAHVAAIGNGARRQAWTGPVFRPSRLAGYLTFSRPVDSGTGSVRTSVIALVNINFVASHLPATMLGHNGWIGFRLRDDNQLVWVRRHGSATVALSGSLQAADQGAGVHAGQRSVDRSAGRVSGRSPGGQRTSVDPIWKPNSKSHFIASRKVEDVGIFAVAAYSKEQAKAKWRLERIDDVVLTAGFIVILILLAIPAYFMIVKPLGQAATALRALERGDFDHPVPQSAGIREIRDVLTGLENVRHSLGRLTNKLNEEVAQRTAELENSNRDLLMAKEQAELASRAKTDFLANMSHELRTPLNAIIGFSEIMRLERLGPIGNARYLEYSDDIQKSGRHLLDIIGDILNIAKIEAGQMTLQDETIDVPDLVRQAVKTVSTAASSAGVQTIVDIDPNVPNLYGDAKALTQILHNLLSNAVKFTPRSGRVTVSALRTANDAVCLQVADNGIGMDTKDIPRALTRFERVEGPLSRQYEGTGIGLPLAKSLIELHGGTILIRSQKGAGTTVIVDLPASRSRIRTAARTDAKIGADT